MCEWKLGRFGDLKEFVEQDLENFQNVEISYQRGAAPTLKLYNKKDDEVKSMDISGWNKEAFGLFFYDKIVAWREQKKIF